MDNLLKNKSIANKFAKNHEQKTNTIQNGANSNDT